MRLIDANALRNVFDAMHTIEGSTRFDHLVLLGIKKYIDDEPTIDAVPVVRCRECDQYTPTICHRVGTVVKPFDYCSYGKPKMDGGAD